MGTMMMSLWMLVCMLPCTAVMVVGIVTVVMGRRKRRRAPPSPPGLPVIGHVHMLGKLPHRSLYQLSKAYGPLMSMRLGALPILVASTPHMAKQVLHTHDLTFAGRPRTAAVHHITQGGSGIIFAQPDRYWRLKRQLCTTQLFSNKRLQALKWMREAEVGALLRSLLPLNHHDHAARPIAVRPQLLAASNNIVSRMLLSKRLSEVGGGEEESLSCSMLNEAVDLVSVHNIGDYVPWLAWMDLQGCVKSSKVLGERIRSALQAIIDERRMHPLVDVEENHDLLQVLLSASSSHVEMTDNHIMGVLMDMFTAGTDTTAYTVEWALAALLCNPEKMKRAQDEIDGVVGRSRRVREEDVEKLAYVQAVVKEAMRLYPVAPLLIPHVASKACEMEGFHIEEGMQVYVNVWAIGRDSEWWERPLEFMPERFLGDQLEKSSSSGGAGGGVEVRGLHFQLLPFGSGRRGCPAWSLGLISVQSMLASLLHAFHWTQHHHPIDMSEIFTTTMMMASPLTALPSPRLPPHCYH